MKDVLIIVFNCFKNPINVNLIGGVHKFKCPCPDLHEPTPL